jgi:hypothetical protein
MKYVIEHGTENLEEKRSLARRTMARILYLDLSAMCLETVLGKMKTLEKFIGNDLSGKVVSGELFDHSWFVQEVFHPL